MFEKNVAGMVRGLRDHSGNSNARALYLSETLSSIQRELLSSSPNVKTNAFLKLGYLSMLGVDMAMSQIAIIEIMASSVFTLKRPAMFVASLAFKAGAGDLRLLTTNIFIKELSSPHYLEISVALSCLASICNADIANGVVPSLLPLANHSRAYVRKKVALAIFRVCEISPQHTVTLFPKLVELLADADQTVQAAAVNTCLEIACRNARLVLPLIPSFFHLLKELKNNWTLIKLVKLMQILCTKEPRLWAKLTVQTDVLLALINGTKAKSVQIEFMRFVLSGPGGVEPEDTTEVVKKAIDLLEEFLASPDANIKCIAVTVAEQWLRRIPQCSRRESIFGLILKSVDSTDATLRAAAVRVIGLMANTPERATHVIQQLLALFTRFENNHTIQQELVEVVLDIGNSTPELISDTEWFLRILILVGCDANCSPLIAKISGQFKRYACKGDLPGVGVKIALAALNRPNLPLPLFAACVSVLAHSSEPAISESQIELLVSRVVAQRESPDLSTLLDCIWNATRLVQKTAQPGTCVAFKEKLMSMSGFSVGVSEAVAICLTLVERGNAELPEISPAEMPDWMHEPLIALPPSYISSVGTSFALTDEVEYTDSEEVEEPSADSGMFSLKSVLQSSSLVKP